MSQFTHTSDLQHVRWEVGAGKHVHTVAILSILISWAARAAAAAALVVTSPAVAQPCKSKKEEEHCEDAGDTSKGNNQVEVCSVEQWWWLPVVIKVRQSLGQTVSQQDAHSHRRGEWWVPMVPHHHNHLVLEEVSGTHGACGAQLTGVWCQVEQGGIRGVSKMIGEPGVLCIVFIVCHHFGHEVTLISQAGHNFHCH